MTHPARGRDEPIFLQAETRRENGSWVVYLEFLFDDGIRSKRIRSYRSESKARVAARWMSWAARREISRPSGF